MSQTHSLRELSKSLTCLLVLLCLTACGGAEPDAEPTLERPTEDAAATSESDPASEQPATEAPTDLPTEAVTEAPTEVPTEAPTELPTEPPAPTAVPGSLTPDASPVPSATPEPDWFVEFYPDNWDYQLAEDQLCAGVNWRSAGVTELVFGREGFSSEAVEAEGRKGDICFPERDATFWLEYRLPDGQVERKTFTLDREK